jgi:hypothetical protein
LKFEIGQSSIINRQWYDPSALTLDITIKHQGNGPPINLVFLLQNPSGEGLFRVSVPDFDRSLKQDRPRIHSFIHQVDGAPGNLDSVFQSLLLCVQARKRGEQGRVNVDDSSLVLPDKRWSENPHETRQANYSGVMRPQGFEQKPVVLRAADPS